MPFHCLFPLNSPLKTNNIVLASDSPASNLEENAAHHSECSHTEYQAQPHWFGVPRCLYGLHPRHRPDPHSKPSAPSSKHKRWKLLWCPLWISDANPFSSVHLWVPIQWSDLWRRYYSGLRLDRDMLRGIFMWSPLSFSPPITSVSMCISVAWGLSWKCTVQDTSWIVTLAYFLFSFLKNPWLRIYSRASYKHVQYKIYILVSKGSS